MSSNSVCHHTRDKQILSVRFCLYEYDYRPNWTPLSPITITYNTEAEISEIQRMDSECTRG